MLWGRARLAGFAVTLASALSITACSDEDEPPFDCTVMPTCDIAQADCQARVFTATACARGQQGAALPSIRGITAQAFAAELREQAGADPNAEPDPWEQALTLLRLAPEGPLIDVLIDNYVSNVVAYYDPRSKQVSLIEDSAIAPENATFILSHEFVHALQDQGEDLIAFQRQATSSDDVLALDALIEGEALLHPNVLLIRAAGRAPEKVDWGAYTDEMLTSAFESIATASSPYFDARQLLPYPVGLRFLIGAWVDRGQSAIEALFANPVLSFRQWALSASPDSLAPTDPLSCFPTRAPPGFAGFDHDRLGITALIGLGVALGRTPSLAFDASATLLDDSLVVFTAADPAQGIAVAWRLRFTSDTAAISFADSITHDPTGEVDHLLVDTLIGQREVLIRAASDPAVYAGWMNAADCGRTEDLPVPPPSDTPSALARRFPPWRAGWR